MTDDKPTIDRIKLLHPKLREEAGLIYQEIKTVLTGKAICRFTHTLRTFAEQDALFLLYTNESAPPLEITIDSIVVNHLLFSILC